MYRFKTYIALCLVALYTLPVSAMNTKKNKKNQYQKKTQTSPTNKPLSTSQPTKEVAAIVADAQPKVAQELITPVVEAPVTALVKIATIPQQVELAPTATITTEVLEETLSAPNTLAQASTPNATPLTDQTTEKAGPVAEAPKIAETPKVVSFAGLGPWSGLKDWWWKTGPCLLSELDEKNNTFQADHPSNQGRVYTAIKEYINTENMNDLALLFKLLAQLQPPYKVGNNEAMQIAYNYLKSKKMVAIESDAQKIISQLIITKQKALQSKIDGYRTTFASELPALQNEIENICTELQNTITTHLTAANTCKQARVNCLQLTTTLNEAGYDSDTEKPYQYSEEIFLKRPNVNVYNTVENFKVNLAQNKAKIQNIQDQFNAIQLLATIEDAK